MLYLTARAIGQAETTRKYIRELSQNNVFLPQGPVIMSPDELLQALNREVIKK